MKNEVVFGARCVAMEKGHDQNETGGENEPDAEAKSAPTGEPGIRKKREVEDQTEMEQETKCATPDDELDGGAKSDDDGCEGRIWVERIALCGKNTCIVCCHEQQQHRHSLIGCR